MRLDTNTRIHNTRDSQSQSQESDLDYTPNVNRTLRIRVPFGVDPSGQGFYWPTSKQKRSEVMTVKRNSPSDFESIYQGHPGARQGTIFLNSDLNAFYATEINGQPFPHTELILGLSSPYTRAFTSRGFCIIQAWDTAFSTTLTSAWTVCVTSLFVPCQLYHCGEDELSSALATIIMTCSSSTFSVADWILPG